MNEPETLEDLLLVEMSRRNTDLVADLIIQKPDLFEDLFEIFLGNNEPVSRRAAWVIDTVSEKIPSLLEPYLNYMTEALPGFTHDGLKRHAVHMLSRSPLPTEHLGELMNICFTWLTSPKESVAVKIYCMDILYNISKSEPDLKKELADSIEWRMQEETPGFRNRARKMLDKLFKEIGE
jgi:hypothetical protein